MQNRKCPICGRETSPDAACPGCEHAAVNGVAKPLWVKPPAPREVANWVIEPVPPEVAEYFRRTFDEAAFLSEMEETLKTGGADIDALIARIERKVHGRFQSPGMAVAANWQSRVAKLKEAKVHQECPALSEPQPALSEPRP